MKTFRKRTSAFSLVEITMALGIVAFGFVAVFGLIPVGLSTFREAMDYSITSQIAQGAAADLCSNNFLSTNVDLQGLITRDKKHTYNDAGELDGSDQWIYWVNYLLRDTALPSAKGFTDPDLKTLVIQVARNPSQQPLAKDTEGLLTGALQSNPDNTDAVQVYTYVTYVTNALSLLP